jgi:hypothetical protein
MNKTLLTVTAALFLFNVQPVSSQTQAVCGERSDIIEKLKSGYGEKPASLGLTATGSMIEVFASDNGTFSIIVTRPGGNSCLVAAGNNWLNVPTRKAEAKI